MPASKPDKWAQYEATAPAAGPDKWAQYEASPAVSAPPVTPAPSVATAAPPEGFWSSLAAPFVDAAKGIKSAVYEGPQNPSEAVLVGADEKNPSWQSPILGRAVLAAKRMLVDPQVDQGKQAVSEFKQADAATSWNSFSPSPTAVEHREQALGHGLAAAIPFLGPWAASAGQKEGEQIGTGNYKGASGTAVGNILLALTPKAAGKAGEAVRATPEALARAITDTGAGPVKELVKKTEVANDKIDAVNTDRLEAQRQAQAKADYDHRANLLKLRQNYEQSVRDATEKARTGTAEDRAKVQSKNLAAKQKYKQDVRDAQQTYQTKRAEAQQANAEAQRVHNQKIGQAAQQNRAATAAERTKADQAGKLQVGGSQLIYGLNQLDKALRGRANQMYGAVREKMAGASLPSDVLANTVKAAQEEWIRGSPVKVAEFNAMLTGGSPGPELTLANQTAQNMGYKDFATAITNPAIRSTLSRALPPDVWEAAVGQGTKPISWNDLQGFYEETGAKIAEGPQPGKGDIFKALQQVHKSIGDQMQQLADAQGAGPQHRAARAFYRNYMDTFHEPTGPSGSGSPVAQALLAKDPTVAVDKFAGDAGDRGIAALRRYSESLANLAQDVRQTAQTKVSVPARKVVADIPAPETTPVPGGANLPLPGVVEHPPGARASNLPLPPVLPEPETVPVELRPRQTISSPDLVAARRAAAEARAGKVQTRGTWVATWPVFQAMRALWGGHIPSLPAMALESAGTFAMTKATAAMMQYPPMMDFLTKARPEDLALIPPDLRGDLPGLVSLAQRQGIKVAPALVAAAAGTGGQATNQPVQQGAQQ